MDDGDNDDLPPTDDDSLQVAMSWTMLTMLWARSSAGVDDALGNVTEAVDDVVEGVIDGLGGLLGPLTSVLGAVNGLGDGDG